MRKILLSLFVAIMSVCLCFGIVSCKDDDTSSSEAKKLAVHVSACEIVEGETFTLVVVTKPDGAGAVTFASADEAIATVDGSGVVTGVSVGTTQITASVGSENASCTVSVCARPVENALTFLVDSVDVRVGGTPRALSVFCNGTRVTTGVTFTSENPAVATIASDGKLTGVAEGKTTITASYGGYTATCSVTVRTILTVDTDKTLVLLKPQESAVITATVQTGASLTAVENPEITWTLADTSVAQLQSDKATATLTATAGGITTLTAEYGGVTKKITVSVAQTVTTFAELAAQAGVRNGYITLDADIDLSGVKASDWTGKGTTADGNPVSVIPELNATLDGNGHKLYGLTLTEKAGGVHNIGFFGAIKGTVRNLMFEGSIGAYNADGEPLMDVAQRHVALFAWSNAGTIENCYVKGQLLTYRAAENSMYTSGMVYMNTGTIRNVLSDILWVHQTSSENAAPMQDLRRYTFAVSNEGVVENCVAVSAQYETKINANGTRAWTTSGIGNVAKGTTAVGEYTFGSPLVSEQYPTVPEPYQRAVTHGDENRKNSYVFDDYEALLDGVGYKDEWKTLDYSERTPVYAEATAAEAHAALGSGFTYDAEEGTVAFMGRQLFQDAGLKYANATISWRKSGNATVYLDGEQIGTTAGNSYNLGAYFRTNAAGITAGEKTLKVQVADKEYTTSITLVKPTSFTELKTAAANKNAYIYLTQDIDLSGVATADWTGDSKTAPVAVIQELNAPLDGNGHKLYGLTLTEKAGGTTNIGFIGTVNADVRNLIFDGSIGGVDEETGYTLEVALRHVGLFAWYNAATIENCYVTGTVTTYRGSSGNGDFTVGMVYKNAGTIKNVLSNVRWLRGKTSEAPKENFMRYAFAVSNALDEKRAGSVENCVSVNEAYESTKKYVVTSGSGKYVRAWTTSAIYSEVAKNATNADGVKYYTFGNGYSSEIYPVVYDNYQQVFSQYDANRSGCLIFETFNGLLNGSGWSDDCTPNHESPVEADEYTAVSGADVQATLGSAWTVDTASGVIKLGNTVLYQRTA